MFKQLIPNSVNYVTSWNEISLKLLSATWLQIALLNSTPQPTFNANVMALLPASSVMGLRVDQVPSLTVNALAAVNIYQAPYLLNDTVSALTGQQVAAIKSFEFANIRPSAVSSLQVSAIPSLTTGQISWMMIDQLMALTCDQLRAFTETQLQSFSTGMRSEYNSRLTACGVVLPPFSAPVATPVTSPVTTTPVMTPVTTPVSSDSPTNNVNSPSNTDSHLTGGGK